MINDLPLKIRVRGKFARLLIQRCNNGYTAEYVFKKWVSKTCPRLHNTHCAVFRLAKRREKVELALLKWCKVNGYE